MHELLRVLATLAVPLDVLRVVRVRLLHFIVRNALNAHEVDAVEQVDVDAVSHRLLERVVAGLPHDGPKVGAGEVDVEVRVAGVGDDR